MSSRSARTNHKNKKTCAELGLFCSTRNEKRKLLMEQTLAEEAEKQQADEDVLQEKQMIYGDHLIDKY